MDEVRLAVEKGYRVFQIYEFYENQVNKYSPETGEGGHFVEYINTFLELKAKASGYPFWVQSPEEEDRYMESFRHSEGIRLDKEANRYNVAKRDLAKLSQLHVGEID